MKIEYTYYLSNFHVLFCLLIHRNENQASNLICHFQLWRAGAGTGVFKDTAGGQGPVMGAEHAIVLVIVAFNRQLLGHGDNSVQLQVGMRS